MNTRDVSYNWLSSGGAYTILFVVWFLCAVFFAIVARSIGREKNTPNDGCLLTVTTTVFVLTGGALGLLLLNKFFPWFIFSSTAGAIIAPWLAIRKFKTGRRRY